MKIVILTASPQRDKLVDRQLGDELRKRGHEVFVEPCLRKGRDTVLKIQPNVVVVPPIRNPYSRDFVETCKGWGVGVVTRHTEASCSWQDFNQMDDSDKKRNIIGLYPYLVDLELVWGKDEAEILNRRNSGFPTVSCGSFAVDIYQTDLEEFKHKEAFNKKLGLDPKKPNLLIGSSWGFADSAPDLQIDEIKTYSVEDDGKQKYIELIKALKKDGRYNLILRPHPGIDITDYKALDVPIETEMTATELLCNCDALIHSGSTMAIEAHYLGIPAYQYGDVNRKFTTNWFQRPDSPLSRVSPYLNKTEEIVVGIGSNADESILTELQEGRYGAMDGKATQRASDEIEKITGEFKMCWPKSHRDYTLPYIVKELANLFTPTLCGVCNDKFFILNQSYFDKIKGMFTDKPVELPEHLHCPHCGSRIFRS
jgi:surface carbohydrate biosynthesis protein